MNRIGLKKSIFAFMVFAFVIGSSTVFAYNHDLYSNFWTDDKTSVFYRVQSTFDATTKTQIGTAMSEWNDVLPSSFLYKSSTETSASSPSENSINTITKAAYGATSFTGEHIPYENSDGRVIESDIRINTSHPWANSAKPNFYDIQSTFTHELGHALRVGHSSTYSDTMYGSASMNTDYKRSITTADDDAANDSYIRWNP